MLLDPETLDLAPRAAEVVDARGGDDALQARAARRAARDARCRPLATRRRRRSPRWPPPARDLAAAAAPLGRLAAAGVHPFADPRRRAQRRRALRRDASASTARSRGASSSARCRCTSRSAAPTARWPSTTRCARTCRWSPRWPPTRRSTPAATPAWRRCGRRSRELLPRQGVPPAIGSLGGVRRRARAGAPRPAPCPSRGAGGGSCGRTRRSGRSRCACPTRRRRSPTPRRSRRSCTRWSPGWPSATTRASRSTTADRGGSRRTAGRPRAAGIDAELADLAPGVRAPARERLAALLDELAPVAAGARLRGRARRRRAAGGAQRRRRASATSRRDGGPRAASPRWLADVYVPGRGYAARPAGYGRGAHDRAARRRAATRPRRCCAALRQPPHHLPPIALPDGPRPARRRGPPARALPLLRAALPRPARRRRALGVGAVAARAARGARGALRGRAARRGRADRRRRRARRRWTSRCARSPTPTTRPSLSRHLERDGDARPGARVRRAPLGLPAQGGRPALVGDPAPAAARRRPRSSRSRPTSTAAAAPERVHAQLFADAMEALGLDAAYGAYLDRIPRRTLATVNLMSLLGLHRRLRGAIVGHLALFEMTSSIPNRRYAHAACGGSASTTARPTFFDEHVEADAVHETIAAVDLAGGLARAGAGAGAGDILWGARALVALEGRWARAAARRLGAGPLVAARAARRRPASARARRSGSARRLEAHELVRPVAERADARLAAAAQRDGLAAARRSRCRPGRSSRNGAAHEQRPVAVGRDRDVVGHRARGYPIAGAIRRRGRRAPARARAAAARAAPC